MSQAWLLDWNDVSLDEKLARGAFGEVWKAKYRKIDVAVKKMFDTEDAATFDDDDEIHFLQRVRHPRLVMFIGAGRMPDQNLFLVLEYMELGGMDELIENHEKDRALSWTVRTHFVM